MKKSFMPSFADRGQLFDNQLTGLKWTIAHAYYGSTFYRKHFEEAGVYPEDICTLKGNGQL